MSNLNLQKLHEWVWPWHGSKKGTWKEFLEMENRESVLWRQTAV